MLMEIDPLSMRGSMVMMIATISPSRRDISPAEQLRRSPRLVSPRFRLEMAALHPKSFLMIFFPGKKTPYTKRWASGACQGAHEAGACPGGRVRPHPRGQGVGPIWNFFRPIFFIYSGNNFLEVSACLELCRIGGLTQLFQVQFSSRRNSPSLCIPCIL